MPSTTSSDCEPSLIKAIPTPRRALASIWTAIERLQEFPDLGMTTENPDIRQIVVRFGSSGYIVRYAALPADGTILITRIWHGREART
jgi:plasmid stabilization system protein ParE